MAQKALNRFVSRAPRYVLQPEDERFLRFAHQNDINNVFTTEFVNISTTGLAFVIDRDEAPAHNEMIKIEVPIPGGEQIAWWGRVARIADYQPTAKYAWVNKDSLPDDSRVLVGIEFLDLPEGHTKALETGIESKSKQVFKRRMRLEWSYFLSSVEANRGQFVLYLLYLTFACLGLYQLVSYLFFPESFGPSGLEPGLEKLFEHKKIR